MEGGNGRATSVEPLEDPNVVLDKNDGGGTVSPRGTKDIRIDTNENVHNEIDDISKRKRRRDVWERTKKEQRRFDLHRGLGNIVRRAEDLFAEVRRDSIPCISFRHVGAVEVRF